MVYKERRLKTCGIMHLGYKAHTSLDLELPLSSIARRNQTDHTSWNVGDRNATPFPERMVDVVTSVIVPKLGMQEYGDRWQTNSDRGFD